MIIRYDGKEYDLTKPHDLATFNITIEKARTDAAESIKAQTKRADELQAKVDQHAADEKKRLDAADKAFPIAVAARVALEGAASRTLGAEFDAKGKSDREVMLAVIRSDSKDFDDKDKSDDYVRSRFDAVCEKGVRADSITSVIQSVQQVKTSPETKREDAIDPDAAAAKMRERNANAWKGTPAN